VTSDAAVLCTKTGNATILRGGSESIHSNAAIAAALSRGGAKAGLPEDAVLLIPTTDREAVKHLCAMDKYLDVIVPRGGKGLIETVVSHARMPVIKHYDGICIIYVDRDADLAMAENIVINAKVQRPGVCNAVETVLVHRDVAEKFFATAGRHRHERRTDRRALPRGGRFGDGLLERLHAFHRRRRVWFWGGDRHLDRQAPRARPDGARRTHDLQIPAPRHRPDSDLETKPKA
jgi:gamma-glutamyl phosphate reductase